MEHEEMREAMERVYQARASLMSGQVKARCPSDVMPMLDEYSESEQEHFIAVLLNGANEVIKAHVVTLGLANRTIVHPRETFREAVRENAVSIIIAHNHPSGALLPSSEDSLMTERLIKAGQVLGIPVLDSLIIGRSGYYSFLEKGRI